MKRAFVVLCLVIPVLLRTASAVEFSTFLTAGKRVTVCRVDFRSERLNLFLRDEQGRAFNGFAAIDHWLEPQHRKLIFAMNAGMYRPDYSPVGLFVAGGSQLAPLNLSQGYGNFFLKPNGVFLVTSTAARVVDSSEYSKVREPVILATQSGPLLVHSNKIHPAFLPNSDSRLIRNGVGIQSPEVVFFVISEEPVNFYEFATLFRDILHCQNALFFDGRVSSLHSIALRRSDMKTNLGPIIGITAER